MDPMQRRLRLYAKIIDGRVNSQRTHFVAMPPNLFYTVPIPKAPVPGDTPSMMRTITVDPLKYVFKRLRDGTEFTLHGVYVPEIDTFFYHGFRAWPNELANRDRK